MQKILQNFYLFFAFLWSFRLEFAWAILSPIVPTNYGGGQGLNPYDCFPLASANAPYSSPPIALSQTVPPYPMPNGPISGANQINGGYGNNLGYGNGNNIASGYGNGNKAANNYGNSENDVGGGYGIPSSINYPGQGGSYQNRGLNNNNNIVPPSYGFTDGYGGYGVSGYEGPYGGRNIYTQPGISYPPINGEMGECRDRSTDCALLASTGQCANSGATRALCPMSCGVGCAAGGPRPIGPSSAGPNYFNPAGEELSSLPPFSDSFIPSQFNDISSQSPFSLSSYIVPESIFMRNGGLPYSTSFNNDNDYGLNNDNYGTNNFGGYSSSYGQNNRLGPYGYGQSGFGGYGTNRICRDSHIQGCINWALLGYCTTVPEYMLVYCKVSCGVCSPKPLDNNYGKYSGNGGLYGSGYSNYAGRYGNLGLNGLSGSNLFNNAMFSPFSSSNSSLMSMEELLNPGSNSGLGGLGQANLDGINQFGNNIRRPENPFDSPFDDISSMSSQLYLNRLLGSSGFGNADYGNLNNGGYFNPYFNYPFANPSSSLLSPSSSSSLLSRPQKEESVFEKRQNARPGSNSNANSITNANSLSRLRNKAFDSINSPDVNSFTVVRMDDLRSA